MKKQLLELVQKLIESNEEMLQYAEAENDACEIEYYRGKLAAYRIIEEYAL